MKLRKGAIVALEILYVTTGNRFIEWRISRAAMCSRDGKLKEAEYYDGADLIRIKMLGKGFEVKRVEAFLVDEVDLDSLFDGARRPFSTREEVRQFAILCRKNS